MLIFSGGVVFQIPAVMGLATDLGMIASVDLRKRRKYAILAIMVFAAVITPTHDMVNMLILAIPMVGLYEIGVVFSSMVERRKK